ncbi:MAG: hypothetical protein AB3X44_07375 [Leptothrix sp. (in: b-proteobacteria)]
MLRNFDRAVGQVLVVLLGPVRRHHDPNATAMLAHSSQRYHWH